MSTRFAALLAMLACGTGLPAADLSLPTRVDVQKRATLNLVLTGADGLAGFQCDLELDAKAMEAAFQAGPAATAAGKGLIATPIASGKWRLIVAGLNQNSLPDGVVALLILEVKAPGVLPGAYPIRLLNAAGATKDGKPVPIGPSDGSVIIQAAE
jgi:hypothetical protein